MADTPEPERELDGDAASKAIAHAFEKLHGGQRGGKTAALEVEAASRALNDRLRGLEAKDGVQRKRYLLGPFEDPSDGPKCLMSLQNAIDDLRSRFEDTGCTELGDELTYRVIELSDAEVEALPEL